MCGLKWSRQIQCPQLPLCDLPRTYKMASPGQPPSPPPSTPTRKLALHNGNKVVLILSSPLPRLPLTQLRLTGARQPLPSLRCLPPVLPPPAAPFLRSHPDSGTCLQFPLHLVQSLLGGTGVSPPSRHSSRAFTKGARCLLALELRT